VRVRERGRAGVAMTSAPTCVDIPGAMAGIYPAIPDECATALAFFESNGGLLNLQYSVQQACNDTAGGYADFITDTFAAFGVSVEWEIPPAYARETPMNVICAQSCDAACSFTTLCSSSCIRAPVEEGSPTYPPPIPALPPPSPAPYERLPRCTETPNTTAGQSFSFPPRPNASSPLRGYAPDVIWPCESGSQCVPIDRSNPDSGPAVCIPCLQGQLCARDFNPLYPPNEGSTFDTTINFKATLEPSITEPRLCLPGFRCDTPSELDQCQAGSYCGLKLPSFAPGESALEVGGIFDGDCPNQVPDNFMLTTQYLYCGRGTTLGVGGLFDFVCKAGYHCPNNRTQDECGAGFYCPSGVKEARRCRPGLFASAESRCPKGSSFEPAWPQLAVYLAVGLVPLLILLEVWSCLERQRRGRHAPISRERASVDAVISSTLQNTDTFDSMREPSMSVSNELTSRSGSTSTAMKKVPKGIRRQMPKDEMDGAAHWMLGKQLYEGARKRVRRASAVFLPNPVPASKPDERIGGSGRSGTTSADASERSLTPVNCGRSGCEKSGGERSLKTPFRKRFASHANSTPHVSGNMEEASMQATQSNEAAMQAMKDGMDASVRLKGRTLTKLELGDLTFRIGRANVLSNINVVLQQGELVALMGESGSGKTTLLNVIGGRAGYGSITGTMVLNHRPYDPHAVRHLLGYVPQAHLVYKELTVYENLAYAAMLRLNRHVSPEHRAALIEMALDLLGLKQCRHFVCDPSIGQRLSGGQMRRIGIGIELVCDPPIMLLDEPTSALDAVNTRLVVCALKNLTRRGVLVCASLHQPRHAVYEMIDRLLLLRKGELIYGGLRSESLKYFSQLGFSLVGANPADFFIEVAFGFELSSKKHRDLPPHFGLRPRTTMIIGPMDVSRQEAMLQFEGFGLRWARVSEADTKNGREIDDDRLREALASSPELSVAEWQALGMPSRIGHVTRTHYIVVNGVHYCPSYRIGQVTRLERLCGVDGESPTGFWQVTYWERAGVENALSKLDRTTFRDSVISAREDLECAPFWIRADQCTNQAGTPISWQSTVRADFLGVLWRNFFRVASSSVKMFMDQIAQGQSEERRRVISVLLYAKRRSRRTRRRCHSGKARSLANTHPMSSSDAPSSPDSRQGSRKNVWNGPKINVRNSKLLPANVEALISLPGSPRSRSSHGERKSKMYESPSPSNSCQRKRDVSADSNSNWVETLDYGDDEDGTAPMPPSAPWSADGATHVQSTVSHVAIDIRPRRVLEESVARTPPPPTPIASPRATFSGDLSETLNTGSTTGGSELGRCSPAKLVRIDLSREASLHDSRTGPHAPSPPSPQPSPPDVNDESQASAQRDSRTLERGDSSIRREPRPPLRAKSSPRLGFADTHEVDEHPRERDSAGGTFHACNRSHSSGCLGFTVNADPAGTSNRQTINLSFRPTLSLKGLKGSSPPVEARSRKSSLGSGRSTPRTSHASTPRSSSRNDENTMRAEENLREKFTKLGVGLDHFKEWFFSDEGFGDSMEEELAYQLWHKAAILARLSAQESRSRWQISKVSVQSLISGSSASLNQREELFPSWTQLRKVMHAWPMPHGDQPRWAMHFYVCTARYTLKLLRKRLRIYFLLLVTGLLGSLCGGLHGANPGRNDLLIFYLLFNTMFGSICSTSTIATFGEDVQFFSHEAASGVRQSAEGLARLLIDVLPLSLLAPVFALPLQSLATVRAPVLIVWLLFGWAMTPLGYIFGLLAPGNATVLTSSTTFVLCAFANGYFGIKLSSVPLNVQPILKASPGYAAFFLVSFGSAVAEPHSTTRYALTRLLQFAGMLPGPVTGENKYALYKYEHGDYNWLLEYTVNLAMFGLLMRILTWVLFFSRSTPVSAWMVKLVARLRARLRGEPRPKGDATADYLDGKINFEHISRDAVRASAQLLAASSQAVQRTCSQVVLGMQDRGGEPPPAQLASPVKSKLKRLRWASNKSSIGVPVGVGRERTASQVTRWMSILSPHAPAPTSSDDGPPTAPPTPPQQTPSPLVELSIPHLALGRLEREAQINSSESPISSVSTARETPSPWGVSVASNTSVRTSGTSRSSWWMSAHMPVPTFRRTRPRAKSGPPRFLRRSSGSSGLAVDPQMGRAVSMEIPERSGRMFSNGI